MNPEGLELRNEKFIVFDPFRLDVSNECLWKGSQAINLRPKVFAVLDYLLSRPHQLVTKVELMNAVWPDAFVGDAVLKVAIRQIREALEDDSKSPRFIETAHRRGYRFIGSLEGKNSDVAGFPDRIVGRDEVLSRMEIWLEKMLDRERQIVFVTGEAGIGKMRMQARRLALHPHALVHNSI